MTKRTTRVCQTEQPIEFDTPDGGTLVYGPCHKHGFFTAIIHCPTSDVKQIASALLEAVANAEAKRGPHGNSGARKTPKH